MKKVKILPNKNTVVPMILTVVAALTVYEFVISPTIQKQRQARLGTGA